MKLVRLTYGSTIPAMSYFSSDLLWASGMKLADPFFLLEFKNGRRVIFVNGAEYPKVKNTAKENLSVRSLETETGHDDLECVVSFLKKRKIKKIIIPDSSPVFVAKRLTEAKMDVSSRDDVWFPERIIKEKIEIEYVVQVQKVAEKALGVAREALKNSAVDKNGFLFLPVNCKRFPLTAESLRTAMGLVLEKYGHTTPEILVGFGRDSSNIHAFSSGPIKACQPIVIDVFPYSRRNGYWGDMTRTFFKGKPSPEVQKMYVAVLGAMEIAMQMIRAGVCGSAVYNEVVGFFEKTGYRERYNCKTGKEEGFIHALGHGVGVDIHEWPILCETPARLAEGMVLAVEPGLYYSKAGGVRIEDTVLVRKNGIRNLTSFPKDLDSVIL